MKEADDNTSNGKLRKKAEQLLKSRTTKSDYSLSESEALKLIHALEVHQIELELQNEELRLAKNELASVSKKYTDLYEFAPNGYFTLTKEGKISELNLTGAKLLGKNRSEIINSQFGFYVSGNSNQDFSLFLENVFTSLKKESAEIILSTNNNQDQYIYLTGIVNENRDQCSVSAADITDKKLAELTAKKSNKRYEGLVDLLPEAVFEFDEKLNLTYVNRRAIELFGYSESELTSGLNALDMIIPEEREKAKSNFARRVKGKNPGNTEYTALKKDGSTFPILFHANSIVENGKLLGARGIIIDISELKQAEQELLESEKKFKNIFNNSVVGKSITDIDGGLKVNKAFSQIVGYLQEELNQMKWQEFTHPDDIEKNEEIVKSTVSGKIKTARWEKRYIHKKGHIVWADISTTLQRDNAGQPQFLITSIIDITERKHAEEELLKSYNLLNNLTSMVPGVVYQYRLYPDGHSTFPYSSPGIYDIYEVMPEDVKEDASPVFTRIHPEDFDYIVETINESAKKQTLYHGEFRVNLPKQGLRWRLCDAKPQLLEDGSTLWHGVISDITDKKKAEKEIIEAKEKAEESDRLKSAFLANMSHEIRTPMNGILGFADLLKEPQLTGEEQQSYVGIIEKSGERMLNIINNIINISKIESGQMEVSITSFDVSEQLENILSFFKPEATQKGIDLVLKNEFVRDEDIILSDKEKLNSVIINLVKNAIKYCDKGHIEFGFVRVKNELEFFVKDTGPGIPEGRHLAIFDRFVQADIEDRGAKEGSGLGLAISKSFVELLGGNIWVESKEGKGSSFFFTLPYKLSKTNNSGVSEEQTKNESIIQIKNLKILIVEDDRISEILMETVIGSMSREILKAQTGHDSVEICRKNPDIDLVLMDIHLPKMNGYEATQEIRKFNTDVIILAQTAFALEGDREKAIKAGCNDYISKPINRGELHFLINKHINRKSK